MKYIKNFENLNDNEPQIGDYVIINDPKYNNRIGQIVNIVFSSAIKVQYENEKYTKLSTLKNVVAFGKTPEELELKLQANKYNL
jgi:hypothetical protein